MAAAALALLARTSGREEYHQAAEDLWRGAAAAGERTDRAVFVAELLLADLELKNDEGAQRQASQLMQLQNARGAWPPSITSQGLLPAALARFALAFPRSPATAEASGSLRRWLDGCVRAADSPFEITPWSGGVFFFPAKDDKEWFTGQNSQYLSQAWALYLTGNLFKNAAAFRLADRQIDWVLGANPANVCMMEGQGSFNFPAYAHRYMGHWKLWPPIPQQERGALPGVIPNGLRRESLGKDRPWSELVINPTGVRWNIGLP